MDYDARVRQWEQVMDAVVEPLVWCWAAIEQLDALHEARRAVVEAGTPTHYGQPERERFWRMRVAAHFSLVATAKFRRALEVSAGVDDRFGAILDRFPVTLAHLRNAMEHDDDKGLWLQDHEEPHSRNEWSSDGAGRLGGVIDDGQLRVDLQEAWVELLALEQSRP